MGTPVGCQGVTGPYPSAFLDKQWKERTSGVPAWGEDRMQVHEEAILMMMARQPSDNEEGPVSPQGPPTNSLRSSAVHVSASTTFQQPVAHRSAVTLSLHQRSRAVLRLCSSPWAVGSTAHDPWAL